MKKILIVVPIVIILVAIVLVGVMANNKLKYEIEDVSEYNYFKLYQSEKYGVIDKSGNVIINPEYEMLYIPNPSKAVFVCYYDYNSEDGEYKTKVFNEKKEELFTDYEKVEAFVLTDTTSNIPFEKSVLKYKKDGKYGLIDFSGTEITSNIYASIQSLEYKEGCFVVEQEGKFGVITLEGNEIVSISYDKIIADGYYEKETKSYNAGFIIGKKTEEGYRYGYINSKGKLLLEMNYNEINRVTNIQDDKNIYLVTFKNGKAGLTKNKKIILDNQYEEIEYNKLNNLFSIQKASKQGVVDITGKQIIPIEYEAVLFSGQTINATKDGQTIIFNVNGEKQENAEYVSVIPTKNENYFITIDKNSNYGVMNEKGETLIKNNYQYIQYAFLNYFIVTNNGKVGILNNEGKAEVDFKYDIIQRIDDTNTMQAIDSANNTTDIYDQNSKMTVSMKGASIYTEDNYIKILSDTDRKYIDNSGKVLSNKEIFTDNELFANSKEGKWGFVDKDGKEVVEYKYDMVTEFNSYGYAGVKVNELWGVVDRSGNVIVEPSYKIDWKEPEFISEYCKLNFGYGFEYYTDEL